VIFKVSALLFFFRVRGCRLSPLARLPRPGDFSSLRQVGLFFERKRYEGIPSVERAPSGLNPLRASGPLLCHTFPYAHWWSKQIRKALSDDSPALFSSFPMVLPSPPYSCWLRPVIFSSSERDPPFPLFCTGSKKKIPAVSLSRFENLPPPPFSTL